MGESFHVVYPIIYFLYTDEFMATNHPHDNFTTHYTPTPPISYEHLILYLMAKKLEIPFLVEILHDWILGSCHPRNITDRMFGQGSLLYPEEMRSYFLSYAKLRWKAICDTPEYKAYCKGLRESNMEGYMNFLKFIRDHLHT